MDENVPLLWHIPLSHFSEKARWALDYKRIARRRKVLGADYLIRAWRATGHGTLLILFLDGRAIRDSTHIIARLEERIPSHRCIPATPTRGGTRSRWKTTSTSNLARHCEQRSSRRCSDMIRTWRCTC